VELDRIQRAQQGDQQAFREVVEQYAALVWRTVRVLLPDRSLTEDVAQEAWVSIWQSLPRFDATRPLRPWLLAIVANRCRMDQRRHALPSVSLEDTSDEAALGISDDVAEQAILGELRAQVTAACAALPPDQQRVVLLRYFADLDLAEIAVVLNVPLGTVKSRLHRALHAVRGHLQQPFSTASTGEKPYE
jgi:RNA polymerase sigma-70 factor (ECF subfamily)